MDKCKKNRSVKIDLLHMKKIIALFFVLVLFPIPTYGQQETGSIEADIKFTNADRADSYGMVLKIYQDFNKTPYKIIESLPSNPFNITSLPLGHKYTVEVYVNSMYAGVGYVNLQTNQQRLDMSIPLSGGMRFNVFFKDGTTPLAGATVLIKSYDRKQWGERVTDDQGKTQRLWIQSTTRDSDYYVADIILGSDINYTYSSVKLSPGNPQEYKVVTPWPSIVNELVTSHVYKSTYSKVTKSDGNFVVELYNSKGTKVAESPVNMRGEAFFSNLKVDTYDFRAKKIEGTVREDWGNTRATIIDGKKPIEVFRIIQETTNEKPISTENNATQPTTSCKCVAFRLDNLQDYWLNNVQIGVIDVFQKKNASITAGVIGKAFGDDPKITNYIKGKISESKPPIEIANNGWEFEDFTKFSKDEQSSLLQKSKERIFAVLGVSPAVFIPPYSKINDDTFATARNNGIRYISAHTGADPPPYLLSNSTVYRFPATAFIGHVSTASGTQIVSYGEAFDVIKKSVNDYGFAVAKINFQDFAVNNGTTLENTLDSEQIQKLESFIDQIRNAGLKIVTIGEIDLDHSSAPIIPSWIKNNAGWWAHDKISDSDFINGIQYMIQKKIIAIKNLPSSSQQNKEPIPAWIKNNAGWWSDGKISDSDFAKGIEFLVKNGIIRVQ